MSLLLQEEPLTTTDLVNTLLAQAKKAPSKSKADDDDDLDEDIEETPKKRCIQKSYR